MTVDQAVATIQRAAREPAVGEPDPAEQATLETAVRELAVHELAMLWQRFLPHVQHVLDRRTDTPVAERLVRALFRGCSEARPSPLVAEPRRVDLAARLRRHDTVGDAARALLATAPHALAVTAIDRYPYDPILPRVPMPEPRDFLARYLAGDRSVWNELLEHAVAIAQHDELREEARAVAGELMKRVRHNADAVRAVLREAGARVDDELAPASDDELARVTAVAGPLPLALDAFWRVAGSITLAPTGACALEEDGLSLGALGPLVVSGTRELGGALDRYERAIAASHREIVGPLALELVRGPRSATVDLPPPTPADAVDPRIHHGRHRLRFVEYLRYAFRWGGFAVLEVARRPIEHVAPADRVAFARVAGEWWPAADRLLAKLRANLVDF